MYVCIRERWRWIGVSPRFPHLTSPSLSFQAAPLCQCVSNQFLLCRCIRERVRCVYTTLEPGLYVIVASTFLPGMEGPFTLTVTSNLPIEVRETRPYICVYNIIYTYIHRKDTVLNVMYVR